MSLINFSPETNILQSKNTGHFQQCHPASQARAHLSANPVVEEAQKLHASQLGHPVGGMCKVS